MARTKENKLKMHVQIPSKCKTEWTIDLVITDKLTYSDNHFKCDD